MATYKEVLDLCDQHNINRYQVNIANEVEFFFINYGGRYLEMFEQLCELVSEAYLKVDCVVSLSAVVQSLYRLIVDEQRDINTIDRYEIIANIQN